jgi:hypothetical protein
MKQNAPSPRPGSVMSEKINLLKQTEPSGVAGLPVPSMDNAQYAGGGIVAFAGNEGSLVGGTQPATDPLYGINTSPNDPMNAYYSFLSANAPKERSMEDIQAEIAARNARAGYGNANKEYRGKLEDYQTEAEAEKKKLKKDAIYEGFLAMAKAGSEGAGFGKGIVAGLERESQYRSGKEKEIKDELRAIDKDMFTVKSAIEQAAMAGDTEAYNRYMTEYNKLMEYKGQLAKGLLEGAQMKNQLKAAAMGRTPSVDEEYIKANSILEARIQRNPNDLVARAAQKRLLERWAAVSRASVRGQAPVHAADARADAAANELNKVPIQIAETTLTATLANLADYKQKHPTDTVGIKNIEDKVAQLQARIAQLRGGNTDMATAPRATPGGIAGPDGTPAILTGNSIYAAPAPPAQYP